MSARDNIRPWCAIATFPGKKPFLCGTIAMPADAHTHTVETALNDFLLTLFPEGFQIIEIKCGSLFFQGEE
jgi:hypothetical protein